MITVSTGTASAAQRLFARDVLQSQRRRLVALLRDLDDDAWRAPTRCSEWSVHEVVRHVCDVSVRWRTLLCGGSLASAGMEAMDPRTTPVEWLERSARERPADTLRIFEQTSADLVGAVERLATAGSDDRVAFPYGVLPWSIVAIHAFWDAWVHERDILLPSGHAHRSPAAESRGAAIYGLMMSCVPALLAGAEVRERVVLDGDGGGLFSAQVTRDAVTVVVSQPDQAGDALRGSLPEVVDAMAGRGRALPDVLEGPPDRVEQLAGFARFMRSGATSAS